MTDSPNELTIENSAVLLPRVAKTLGLPTVLTALGAHGSVLVDRIFNQISELFLEITPIDRTSSAALSDPNLRAAVEATGRKKLVMAGLVSSLAWATEPAR